MAARWNWKFVAVEGNDFSKSVWESGDNRTVTLPLMSDGEVVVYDLTEVFLPLAPLRVAGTLVPVFSLRSKSSFGVGDFGDLKKMIDWVALTRQRVLQVLPINDTTQTHTWTDSYPYSCISIFAIHPQYVDLSALPPLADKKARIAYEQLRSELNDLPQIDYERVQEAKTGYLRLLFAWDGERVMATKAYRQFFQENERWLVPYAQYCSLRDRYGSADFSTLARPSPMGRARSQVALHARHESLWRGGVLLLRPVPPLLPDVGGPRLCAPEERDPQG